MRLNRLALSLLVSMVAGGCGRAIEYRIEHRYGVGDPQFARTMDSLLGPPIVGGNSVKTLVNGDQIFPAMLDAIRAAERTIDLETFIYWKGDTGKQFTDALIERAQAGVRVHVMIDAVGGAKIDHGYLKEMKQ